MKVTNILKKTLLISLITLAFTSCEKEEAQDVPTNQQGKTTEGFESTTGRSDEVLETINKVQRPLLHMRFAASVSVSEAEAQFEAAANQVMAKQAGKKKGVSTEWFFRIRTVTGKQTDNNTDGDVRAGVSFRTNLGNKNANWLELDNFGDDREKGDRDYYMFRTEYPGKAVSWVEAEKGYLMLKGTDGWFITNYDVWIYPSYQSTNAVNSSRFNSKPNIWLDNSSKKKWDRFNTGTIGVGRLDF